MLCQNVHTRKHGRSQGVYLGQPKFIGPNVTMGPKIIWT